MTKIQKVTAAIKIRNATKPIRQMFSTVDDAMSYIRINNIVAKLGARLVIEEVKYHQVRTTEPKFTQSNKGTLLTAVMSYAKQHYYSRSCYVDPNCNISWHILIHSRFEHGKSTSLYKRLVKHIVSHKSRSISVSDINAAYAAWCNTNTRNKVDTVLLRKKLHERSSDTAYNDKIVKLLLIEDAKTFTFYKTYTDYADCNAIVLKHQTGLHIQIRRHDVVFSNDDIYGHNVNVRHRINLTDNDMQNNDLIKNFLSKCDK